MISVTVIIKDEESGIEETFPRNFFDDNLSTLPEEITWRGLFRALRVILKVKEGVDTLQHAVMVSRWADYWIKDQQKEK